MKVRVKNIFTTVRSEGAMLPIDLLQRVVENDKNLKGLTPADYHLLEDEKLNEAINRSWSRLRGAWVSFQTALEKLPEGDAAIKVTRDRFLLPLFQELGYGRLGAAKSLQVSNPDTDAPVRTFPISHMWMNTPIHLVGFGVDLDKRTKGIAGAAKSSPHSLVQEFLNRSDEHLWAFVSNGKRLRILRDNASLTRQAYVEFDLEAMMAGEVYADFVLLWLLCHQSRVEAEKIEKCWLEQWSKAANEQGKRALEDLRGGVQTAIERLGQGFLSHSANKALREKLYSGELNTQDYYRQLLRLVYRLLFLFVAEDRELLLDPNADEAAKDRYRLYYSTAKLRTLAERRRGSRHSDLFQGLWLVMEKLGSAEGCPEIGLPALGSFLWSFEAVLDLVGNQSFSDKPDIGAEQLNIADEKTVLIEPCQITNADFLDALRALAFITDKHGRRPVDYKNLQSEELGSVYESLLELHPELNRNAGTFVLETDSGNERKTTGSYYTPDSLVQCLLDSALNPVLEEAALKPDAEAAILALKVCDPACGSGHFLIAAAHRMAKRLAFVRTGDEEPSPMEVQRALRDVIGRCMYGVDINSMAVELCKVALWMEALEPGKPLSFLDHHIQCGNSLIGATPALLRKGIPDAAFKPIEGDDEEYCARYKQQNKEERTGQMKLFDPDKDNMPWQQLGNLAVSMTRLDDIADYDIAGIERKRSQYEGMVRSAPYLYGQFWADAWCAAFVLKKTNELPYSITENTFRLIELNPHNVDKWIRDKVEELSECYHFFHWHLAFPDVFYASNKAEENDNKRMGWKGGFDSVIGNPPWGKIKIQEKEWFAGKQSDITNSTSASQRRSLIARLSITDPELLREFKDDLRTASATSHFLRTSGCFPLCSRGDINTFAIFAELKRNLLNREGIFGCIVPPGIATNDTYKKFIQDVIESNNLKAFFAFTNRGYIFADVESTLSFALLVVTNRIVAKLNLAAKLWSVDELKQHDRIYSLTAAEIRNINPNTQNLPIFENSRDADLIKSICKKFPILIDENKEPEPDGWRVSMWSMFHMSNDSGNFRDFEFFNEHDWEERDGNFVSDSAIFLPLYESKLIGQYNHRAATFHDIPRADRFKTRAGTNSPDEEDLNNPDYRILPRYWISQKVVDEKTNKSWSIGFRNAVSAVADSRSLIVSVVPRAGVGNSLPLIQTESMSKYSSIFLLTYLNSFFADYLIRQKASGGNLNFYIMKQLSIASPYVLEQTFDWDKAFCFGEWIRCRAIELIYTALDLREFAIDHDYEGMPFRWNESRRFLLRCELDAAYFHLYNIQRDDVDYIMETFPIVKREDEKAYGDYRTKDTILQIFDAMTAAIESGHPYQTLLDPPPADPRLAHPPRTKVD